MRQVTPYKPKNKIRIVTATSLFDGHDAAINIMRRIIQSTGCEVIHLGHNRSVEEVVNTAIQEDAQAIAMTSYQGGHIEYFKYMRDLLNEKGANYIKIFGGGGGVILSEEIEELHAYGIDRIYSPDDGRKMTLQGMINDMVEKCDFPTGRGINGEISQSLEKRFKPAIARLISGVENYMEEYGEILDIINKKAATVKTPVLGIAGTGGAGKSSLLDELVRRFLLSYRDKPIAILSTDPSKKKTGGALLGDRIRMNAIHDERVYMRSMATRQINSTLSKHIKEAINILKAANYDLIILETSGIGQSDIEIIQYSDVSLYVMTPEYGAATQLEKIHMLDFADIVVLNKFDKRGALDALREVKKQYQRNHQLWDKNVDDMPVYSSIASQFNDPGVNALYRALIDKIIEKTGAVGYLKSNFMRDEKTSEKVYIIPPNRIRYLSEITENNRAYDITVQKQVEIAQKLYGLYQTILTFDGPDLLKDSDIDLDSSDRQTNSLSKDNDMKIIRILLKKFQEVKKHLYSDNWDIICNWESKVKRYKDKIYAFTVRDKKIEVKTHTESLSHTQVPKVSLPKYTAWGDLLKWSLQENVPGEFPYTAGIYLFKRTGEDPIRMFAGEGGPERTNRRFHYVSQDMPTVRLSTAFDSVTLYGNDSDYRPDIYGKIGNSGVSICCLDDAKKLYSGFGLCMPTVSVSMTINGPAPMLLAFFMNAAIDQQCEKCIREKGLENEVEAKLKELYDNKNLQRPIYQGLTENAENIQDRSELLSHISVKGNLPKGNSGLGLMLLGITGDQILDVETYNQIKARTLSVVRGTVQADILKEDQAQNTCIFSTEFALRLMGDVQKNFIANKVRNFYSVSISGYHIAEAGANPITQLAFTLANGFTYVEYYLSCGMHINDFGHNLSFFFSNSIDPEYAVIGRAARRIWSKALKHKYRANPRAQMLKYHIQTSGRSLHAQEIQFNDIRTTLQALYAIYDNCNSLHTNAYDEAITTPTEESVRRAIAIQMIINKELGLAKNENPIQGSFIIEELTDLVEEAVLTEFDRITEGGGVLGSMETMYQRSKIQEESLYYETLKHTGEFPVIGVNTFRSSTDSPTIVYGEVIRATKEEKQYQIEMLNHLQQRNKEYSNKWLRRLQDAAIHNKNMFNVLMETVKYCSLGQITNALFEVGGQYRRNM